MWHCLHLPAAAAASNQYFLPAGPTAATRSSGKGRLDGTDRQINARQFHRP